MKHVANSLIVQHFNDKLQKFHSASLYHKTNHSLLLTCIVIYKSTGNHFKLHCYIITIVHTVKIPSNLFFISTDTLRLKCYDT